MRKSLSIAFFGLLLFGYGWMLYKGSREVLALSPGLMPMLLGGFTLVLSLFSREPWVKTKFPLYRSFFILLYFVVWIFAGFWISTLSFCFLGFYVLAEKKAWIAMAYSFLLTLSMDLIFVRFFSILLP